MFKNNPHTLDENISNLWELDSISCCPNGANIIKKNGNDYWCVDGLLHREDGPAIEGPSGVSFYRYGKLHRDGGPAVELKDGTTRWYQHGVLHREDGPASEDPRGRKEWWFNGERHRDGGPAILVDDVYEVWYKHNKMHRVDGPSVISRHFSDTKVWYLDGNIIKSFKEYQDKIGCTDEVIMWLYLKYGDIRYG